MLELSFHKDESNKLWFTLTKSYYPTVISLLVGNNLVVSQEYPPCEHDKEIWFSHPFVACYSNFKIKLLRNYFSHKGHFNTDLFYIHPDKCGGSSIEVAGYEHGIRWGRWHPSQYSYHSSYKDTLENNPEILKDKTLFTSTRNPYTRLISSLYCPYHTCRSSESNITSDVNIFNDLIKEKIQLQIPLYDFVYYQGKKVVPHVLKLENLTSEFNQLMFDYNSEVRMEKHTNKSSDLVKTKRFGVQDISKENILLINEKFKQDFIHFNYKTIN